MENTTILDEQTETSSGAITAQSLAYLRTGARWAKFLSIVGFFFVSLYLLFVIIGAASAIDYITLFGGTSPITAIIIIATYFAIVAFYFLPFYYLYSFSTSALDAVKTSNFKTLGQSFKNLKSFFKFLGIVTIVFWGSIILFILFAILSVIFSG